MILTCAFFHRFLSEFFLYIPEDLHTCQSLPQRRKVRITPAAAARFAPARARARVRACLQHSILYSKLLYSKFTQWEVLLWIIRLGACRFKNLYADLRTYILYCPSAERFASPPPPPPPHGSRLRVRARRACVCACTPAPPRARLCARILINPHRHRWSHRPRHQGSSSLLATAKAAKLACAGGYTYIEII
jgi:hypothetical protein